MMRVAVPTAPDDDGITAGAYETGEASRSSLTSIDGWGTAPATDTTVPPEERFTLPTRTLFGVGQCLVVTAQFDVMSEPLHPAT